jgi:hypothetical protein
LTTNELGDVTYMIDPTALGLTTRVVISASGQALWPVCWRSTMSTFANRLTEAPVDDQLSAFA